MKKIKFVSIIIIFVTIFFILLSLDDELDQNVKNLITNFDRNREVTSHAYIYLSGISSLNKKDIVKFGTSNLLISQNLEITTSPISNNKEFGTLDSITPKKDSSFYCSIWKNGCLERIVSSDTVLEVELDFRKILLERYKEFLSYIDYSTLTSPIETEVYPNYQYLFYGNRLLTFENLLIAKNQNSAIAISNLVQNIKKLKIQLSKADNLLFKLTLVAMISESLDMISHIKITNKPDIIISIDSLSKNERSLEPALEREFVYTHNVFRNANRNPELFNLGGNAYPWFVRLSYKPNMTINDHYPLYSDLITLSKLSLVEFAVEKSKIKEYSGENINLRNIFGHSLFELGLETQEILIGFIARINDLDAKIALINYVLGNGPLTNPYYPLKKAGYENDGQLCLKGPLPDTRNFRCVKKKPQI